MECSYCKVPILMYHNIATESTKNFDREKDHYTLANSQFEQQMKFLYTEDFKVISLRDFVIHLKEKKIFPPKAVVISFDDGHLSNYTEAYPILRKYGFTAIFFVTVGFIGTSRMLTWKHMEEMVNNGMEIGSHTLTHSAPAMLTEEELRYELKESKDILENHLDIKIKFLSSPTGYSNTMVSSIAKEIGYEALCMGAVGGNGMNADLFSLKRIAIKSNYSFSTFKSLAQLQLNSITYYRATDAIRTLARKLIGAKYYEPLRNFILHSHKSVIKTFHHK